MDVIIEFVIIFALGWWIGSLITAAWMRIVTRELLKDLGITDQQLKSILENQGIKTAAADEKPQLEVRVEQHQGVLFAYRCDTGLFLGQGTSQASLVESITRRLQGVRLIIREENGAELLQKNPSQTG